MVVVQVLVHGLLFIDDIFVIFTKLVQVIVLLFPGYAVQHFLLHICIGFLKVLFQCAEMTSLHVLLMYIVLYLFHKTETFLFKLFAFFFKALGLMVITFDRAKLCQLVLIGPSCVSIHE